MSTAMAPSFSSSSSQEPKTKGNNVFHLQQEAVTKMLQTTSMGQYFLGETKLEDFFVPDRTYVPHNEYEEQLESAPTEELPILDLSADVAAAAKSGLILSETKPEDHVVGVLPHDPTKSGLISSEIKPKDHVVGILPHDPRRIFFSELLEAAESWGFFAVVNHGISSDLISRMQAHAHRFFRLPLEHKLKVSPGGGSLLYGYTTGSPNSLPTKWWNESLQLEWNEEQVQMFCDQLCSQEEEEDQAHIDPRFQEDFLEFMEALGELGRRIMGLLAEGLGLDPEAFNRHFRAESKTTLRLNYYPPCPHPDKIEGMYEHSDASMMSILHQDQVGGLQILRNGKWVAVRPNPASFVVNIGEIVMMMSNERFSSVVHRAVANSSEPRLSMVFFCAPVHEDVMTVAEGLTDATHPAKFRPFIWKDYLSILWKKDRPGYYRV